MPARTSVVGAAIILAAALSDQGLAQQQKPQPAQQGQQAWDWCKNQGGGVSADLRINGCTTVIQSGRETPPNLATAFNLRGNAYWAKKEYDRATADYEQAIRLNPNDAVFYSNRAGVYAAQGQYDRAIVDFDQAIRVNPNLARTFLERGHTYRNKGLYDRAIADYDQAIKLDPKNVFAFNNRGNVYYIKKDFDRAIADLDQSLRINPNQPFMYNLRATVNFAKKDYDRAIADYDQAVKLDPNYAFGFHGRGNAYYAKKDYDRAIADFDQAVKLNPNLVRAYNSRANTYSSKGQYDRALADYEQVLRLEPNPYAYVGRCLARTILGQPQEALADCNEAQKLLPNDARPLGTRGLAYFKLGQFDAAIADYDAALRIDSKRAPSLYGRGLARQRKGDVGGGNADIAAATALKSDVAEQFARYGEEPASAATAPVATNIPAPDAITSSVTTVDQTKSAATGDFQRRVALVIGNSNYATATPLRNPRNDAADMAAALRKLGFEVVEGTDLTRRGLDEVIRDFSRKLDGADLALFFYAGHGLQVNGRNYLVPIDAKLERPGDLALDAVDVGVVLAQMEAEKRVNLVLLDACRDNPLSRSLARSLGTRSTSVGVGLATIQSAIGTLIAYATQPDNTALDGEGRNSPFTTALLKHIATPRVDISTVMRRVRADVIAITKQKQVPWDHSSLIGEVVLAQ